MLDMLSTKLAISNILLNSQHVISYKHGNNNKKKGVNKKKRIID